MHPRRRVLFATPLLMGAITAPALAHPGDHHGMTLAELISHYSSGWHALPLVIATAGALAVLLFKPFREAKAKAKARSRERDDA